MNGFSLREKVQTIPCFMNRISAWNPHENTACNRRYRIGVMLLGIVLAALLIRIYAFEAKPYLQRDEFFYLEAGEAWSTGGMSAMYVDGDVIPPFFPMLTQATAKFLGCSIWTGAATVNIGMGTLMVLSMFGLGTVLGSSRIGLIMALLTAVHPELVEYSAAFLREASALALFSGFLLFYALALNRFAWSSLAAGAAIMLAVICRPEYIEALFYTFLFEIVYWFFTRKNGGGSGAFMRCVCCLAGFVVTGIIVSLILNASWHFWPDFVFRRFLTRVWM